MSFGKKSKIENVIISLVNGWILTYILCSRPSLSAGLSFTMEQNFVKFLCVLGVAFGINILAGFWCSRMQHVFLPAIILTGAVSSMERINSPWILLGFGIMVLLALWYVKEDIMYFLCGWTFSNRMLICCYVLMFAFLLFFMGLVGYFRYASFLAPDADLGIFSQIFESMRRTGRQMSTVEREFLMSHFRVHISPVLYLLLPVYFVFSTPVTLQISQAFLLAASLLPLYLLGKHYGLTNKAILAIGLCYTLFPALTGGSFSDFHENCFLPLLLLSLILSIEKKNNLCFAVFAALCLSVKEDAAIYLIFFSLYLIFSNKDRKRGSILLCFSAGYFVFALFFLQTYGLGVLGYMDNMYLSDAGGAAQAVKTVLMNPGYTLRQLFDVPVKREYLLIILLPLNIALLSGKKYYRYLLLMPMILLNLIPDYSCLTSIYFQYQFAVSAILFYIALTNISEWKAEKRRFVLLASVTITFLLFTGTVWKIADYHINQYKKEKNNAVIMENMLSQIPETASVAASERIVPHLYRTLELYPLFSNEAEYLAIDLRGLAEEEQQDISQYTDGFGYALVDYREDVMGIYRKKVLNE